MNKTMDVKYDNVTLIMQIIHAAIIPMIGWFWHYIDSRLKQENHKIEKVKEDLRSFYTKQETDKIIASEMKNIDEKLGHIKELFLYHVNRNENK